MSDAGAWEVRVDTLGFLANNLRGYEPTSILREQLQNADDASFKQGRRGELRLSFCSDRLVVTNPSVFTDEDWHRLVRPNSRGKFHDADQTGEFGVGFWGSLHLTDAPIVTSGALRVRLDPLGPTTEAVAPVDGTEIEFRYRRRPTKIGEQLDAGLITPDVEAAMAATFVHQMAELLLFTRAIESITIELPDGSIRRARRIIEPIAASVERLNVAVEGAPDEDCHYLIVRSQLDDPPPGRHGRVTVALPLTERHRGPGRAFFMFPTETDSGLHVSVDAHFRATDDRRSLENSGQHGAWNDRIFEEAGRAVGHALETVLDPAVHGLDVEDAIEWFAPAGSQLPDIARRAGLFTKWLDAEARRRQVIPDRSGRLRRGSELVDLPAEVEGLLAEAVGETALPARRQATRVVYQRWGLETWGAPEVAAWLQKQLPNRRTPRTEMPVFISKAADAVTLLDFCRGQERTLHGVALLLGTDEAYHPIGGSLARPADEHQHLVTGLERPLVSREFLGCWAARLAPRTTPQWLREALIDSADKLVGRRVPIRNVGAASKQQHVSEAIGIVSRAAGGLEGVPLALDEEGNLQRFDATTIVGLPDGNRKAAERLARRLGVRPLHKAIDDETTSRAGHRFTVSLINERLAAVTDWDPIADSRLLVEVLGSIAQEGSTSSALIEQLRSKQIWQGSDGKAHGLQDLRLPARDRVTRSSRILVANELVGELDPASLVYATLRGLLRVDVLDTTEEAVLACEDPPVSRADRRQLLIDLGDCDHLSKAQIERLQASAFVLCNDGHLRRPNETLLARDPLPLTLGDRCVDDDAGRDRRVREQLTKLGALDLPRPADLLDAAADIARRPLAGDASQDPSRILWDHLLRYHDRYAASTFSELSSVAWLLSSPGPERRKPKECYDPQLGFAKLLFPVPLGVASPPAAFRDALRMRATLETDDCVRLGRRASEEGHPLGPQFFQYLNRRCERNDSDLRKIADLRSVPLVPLSSGPTAPAALVSRERAEIWGHLRSLVPDQFVADYPNLLRAWGVVVEGAVGWSEHLDVLDELARRPELTSRDRALAWERLRSVAMLSLDEHQTETVRRRGVLLTSAGLHPCSTALRRDLPPTVVARLEAHLPIVEESAEIEDFLDRLRLRSLRDAVTLDPIVAGVRTDDRWPATLRTQAENVLRFLKASGTHLDRALLEAWPPIVKGVASLTVRASCDGRVLAEWTADAHLAHEGGELVLYVSGSHLDARSVVDAIASEFGVDRGRKTLLLSVLQAGTTQAGTDALDWEDIPRLTEREASYLFEHEATTIVFTEPEVFDDSLSSSDVQARDHEDSSEETQLDERKHRQETDLESSLDDDADSSRDRIADRDAELDLPPTTDPEADTQPPESWFDETPYQSSRGSTDLPALEDQGIVVVRDLDVEPSDDDYRPTSTDPDAGPLRDEVRVCLSFFDVSHGVIPVTTRDLAWLTSNVPLREVELFGAPVPAVPAGPKHVQLQDGASIFHSRQVVPGTVMRVHPSIPGKMEIEVRPDLHRIDGVWMLELDEAGKLTRLRQDDVELQWETDDAFYRAERRLEDIEALMADGGKSAVQLIIEVFLARPGEGLSVDEIWGLVAISRLFAKSTISQTLSTQTGLFEHRQGLWHKVGDELRLVRSARKSGTSARSTPAKASHVPEAVKLARKLAQLLVDADDETLNRVVQLLGIKGLLHDREFAQSCAQCIGTSDDELLAAIEREVIADPGRATLVIEQLEALTVGGLEKQRDLLDLVVRVGSASAVRRASVLLTRLDSAAGVASGDPLEVAEQLLVAAAEGAASHSQLLEGLVTMWNERRHGDPLESPTAWMDTLVEMEDVHRSAAQLTELSQPVLDARGKLVGWLGAQLPGEVYDDQEVQQLRVVLDLLLGRPSEWVLDGLHQLGLLAENAPSGEGDAALIYALVGAHARSANIQSPLVDRSAKRVASLRDRDAGIRSVRFIEAWTRLARLPMADVLRPIEDR